MACRMFVVKLLPKPTVSDCLMGPHKRTLNQNARLYFEKQNSNKQKNQKKQKNKQKQTNQKPHTLLKIVYWKENIGGYIGEEPGQ